jgi:hypothetical protein
MTLGGKRERAAALERQLWSRPELNSGGRLERGYQGSV